MTNDKLQFTYVVRGEEKKAQLGSDFKGLIEKRLKKVQLHLQLTSRVIRLETAGGTSFVAKGGKISQEGLLKYAIHIFLSPNPITKVISTLCLEREV